MFADDSVREKLLATVRLDRFLDFTEQRPQCLGEPVVLDVSILERTEFGHHLLETHRKLAELGGPAAGVFRRAVEQLEQELEDLS